MKKIYLILFSLMIGVNLKAADLYVNSSGAAGTYTSLTAAVQAANDGDRIIISTLMNLVENVTINKSVTVTSASAGTTFTLNGTMTIEAVANKEIRIIGGDISALSFSSGNATDATACKFYLVDSQVNTDITANIYGLSFNMLYCEDDNSDLDVTFKFGSIIGSSLRAFQLSSGTGTARNDTTYIISNKFISECQIYNQDHNYFVANNFFYATVRQLVINFNKPTNSGWNNILNNTFIKHNNGYYNYGNNLYFHNGKDYSNTNVYNNFFHHSYTSSSSSTRNKHIGETSISAQYQPIIQYNVFSCYYSQSGGVYWNSSLHSSNYNNYLESSSGYTYRTTDGKITVGTNAINKGNPSIQYYDIDMTRNDLGTYGGPFTWENYHDTTSNGRGRVFNLDMPFEIWMGQTPTIKADAVHKK